MASDYSEYNVRTGGSGGSGGDGSSAKIFGPLRVLAMLLGESAKGDQTQTLKEGELQSKGFFRKRRKQDAIVQQLLAIDKDRQGEQQEQEKEPSLEKEKSFWQGLTQSFVKIIQPSTLNKEMTKRAEEMIKLGNLAFDEAATGNGIEAGFIAVKNVKEESIDKSAEELRSDIKKVHTGGTERVEYLDRDIQMAIKEAAAIFHQVAGPVENIPNVSGDMFGRLAANVAGAAPSQEAKQQPAVASRNIPS